MDDFNLIRNCIAGDKKSWDQLVEKFGRLIYDSIIRTLRKFGRQVRQEDLEDLHQNFFTDLLDNDHKVLKQFEGRNGCSLASYLRVIAVRKTIDYLRALTPVVSLDEVSEQDGSFDYLLKDLIVFNTQKDIEQKDAVTLNAILLQELKEDEQRLCKMIFLDQRNPDCIAEDMGISIDHFYVRKQRMLQKLRKIAIAKRLV